jgi:hypothetical protein
MNRSTSVLRRKLSSADDSAPLARRRRGSIRHAGIEEITLSVPAGLVAALDEYARSHGVTRAEAAGMALYSAPEVASVVFGADVALRDAAGP